MYPAVYGSLMLLLRSRLRRGSVAQWLDGGVVGLAVACSLSNWRPGRAWLLVGAAVTISAVADIVVVYQSANGSYVAGTILDALWPASMTRFALAAWAPVRPQVGEVIEAQPTIFVTLLAAAGALGLLVVAAFDRITPLAVGLAAGALVLACVRAGMTYTENSRMLRRSAREG